MAFSWAFSPGGPSFRFSCRRFALGGRFQFTLGGWSGRAGRLDCSYGRNGRESGATHKNDRNGRCSNRTGGSLNVGHVAVAYATAGEKRSGVSEWVDSIANSQQNTVQPGG